MTKAFIIAGGKGENLRPVTLELPKAVLPVHSRTLLDQSIDLYWKHKVYEIWLGLGYKQESVREKFTSMPFLIDVDHDHRIVPMGTGGWLNRLAQSPGKDYWFDHFYVNNVENVANFDLDSVMEQHIRDKNVVTMVCVRVSDVSKYGSVAINKNRVTNFEEKAHSRVKKPGIVNSGFYIFSPKIFKYVEDLKIPVDKPLSLEKDLFPVLAKQGVIGAVVSDAQWFDTNSFDSYEKLLKEWRGVQ